MKHTPGPWRTGPINYADIYAKDGELVVLCIKDLEETVANAKLVASAPELLEACKLRERHGHNDTCQWELISSNEYPCDCGYAEAVAAISKAEGRAA
jgi:phage-related protein